MAQLILPAHIARQKDERGRQIYNFRCYYCHGYSGDAKTLAASFLQPPPRNFLATPPEALSREQMLAAVSQGRPGTAMKSFASLLNQKERELVVDFIREEFMVRRARNTQYHTPQNGWPAHERYAIAFPFATGQIPLDTPWESLTPLQQAGKRLFQSTCVTCHDRATVRDEGAIWDARAVSYPRMGYSHKAPPIDALASASPYAIHDRKPVLAGLTPEETRGESLFQGNCAFCHGADGTGKNWIGSFMEPHPRNLTDPAFMSGMTRDRLHQTIQEGLPGTSMPAWKNVLDDHEIDAIIAYIGKAFHPVVDNAARRQKN